MAWDILPTFVTINNRFSIPSLDCVLCKYAPKSLEHIFLKYDWVYQLWLLAPWPLNLNNMNNVPIHEWIKLILNPKNALGFRRWWSKKFQLYAMNVAIYKWLELRSELKGNLVQLSRHILPSFEEQKQVWNTESKFPKKEDQMASPTYRLE